MNVLRRVKAQSVQMKLTNPICRVLTKKLAHGPAIFAVKIKPLAPVGGVVLRKIIRRKFGEIVPVRTQMVINHIQNYPNPERVRPIYKSAHLIRRAIDGGRSIGLNSIISP